MATNTQVIMHSIMDIPLNALSIEELRLINEFTEWRRNQLARHPELIRRPEPIAEAPKPQRRIRLDD